MELGLSTDLIGLTPGTQNILFQTRPVEGTVDWKYQVPAALRKRTDSSSPSRGGENAQGEQGTGSTDRLSSCLTEEQGQLLRRRWHCCAQSERLQKMEFMGKGEAMLGNLRDVPSSNVLKTVETEYKENTSKIHKDHNEVRLEIVIGCSDNKINTMKRRWPASGQVLHSPLKRDTPQIQFTIQNTHRQPEPASHSWEPHCHPVPSKQVT